MFLILLMLGPNLLFRDTTKRLRGTDIFFLELWTLLSFVLLADHPYNAMMRQINDIIEHV